MTDVIESEAVEVGQELERRPSAVLAESELDVDAVVAQVQKIQSLQEAVMKDGEHFGVIPGTDKPTLLKPGAEKLCLTFRLAPSYELERDWDGEHLTVSVTARLTHIVSGQFWGEGVGLCSTREEKYAYRTASRTCPSCGAAAIIKGKAQYGGGWLCWKKKDGCGAKFDDGDAAIEGQEAGKVPNDRLPDTYNTVVKMAKKRALVDAVLTATAASDIFTQDLESPTAESAVDSEPPPSAEKPTAAQWKRMEKLLADLEKAMPAHEGQQSWNAEAEHYARRKYGKTPAALTKDELDEVLAEFKRRLDEKDIPFG